MDERIDIVERKLARDGHMDNGLESFLVRRSHDFSTLSIVHRGKVLVSFRVDLEGKVIMEGDVPSK